MASKKPQYQIPAPATGVRKDVDPMILDQTMAADGANLVYFDGTVRPRPALNAEISDSTGIENYQLVLDAYEEFSVPEASEDSLAAYAMASADDQSWILVPTNTKLWMYSRDGGTTWQKDALTWPGGATGGIITNMHLAGDYLYAVTQDYPYWDVYSTPIATILDGGMVWTKMNGASVTSDTRSYFFLSYHSDYDALIITSSNSFAEVPLPKAYRPMVWAFIGVSTGSPTEQKLGNNDSEIGAEGYIVYSEAVWVGDKHLMYSVRRQPIESHPPAPEDDTIYGAYLWSDSLTFDSGTGLFTLTRAENGTEVWYNAVEDEGVVRNPLDIPDVEDLPSSAGVPSGVVDARSGNDVLFAVGTKTSTEYGGQFIGVAKYDDDGFLADDALGKRHVLPDDGYRRLPQSARRTEEKIVYFFDNSSYDLPELYVSSDNGKTFLAVHSSQEIPHNAVGAIERSYFNDVSDQHYFLTNIDPNEDLKRQVVLYLMPSSSGTSKFGEFNSVFQVDLDDEEDAIVVGTTKAIARLNKDTNTWDVITASQEQYIDGSTGDDPEGPYTPDGVYTWDYDIPPLTVSPGDDAYVSGLTIDTVYGQNPWVFRAFESSGKTFLLATNGQCYPLVYHSDMNGGFARRMGEVPTTNDPNYRAMSQWETDNGWLSNGNLAPRGRCMAVAANRVLLANNPTGSPFEVNVGGFNDMDRGWGTTNSQLVLLGDTAGEIITMEEISALQVAIYKEDAIYHAIAQTEFLGVSAPFRFELAKAGVSGPCSPASVLRNFDGRQIYLARDGGVYMYDGVAPLDGGRNIRRMIQNDIDLNQLGKCWGMVDHQRKLVWFFYPGRNQQVNKGIVISTDQGYPWPTWPVELPGGWNFTCGAEINLSTDSSISDLGEFGSYNTETLSSFNSGQVAMLTGRETGVFFTQKWDDDGDYTDSGLPIKCRMKGGWLTPGGLQIHTADELYHIFSSPDPEQEILVRLRAQKIGQNIVSSPWRTLTADKPRRRTRHRVSGTQFGIDLKADAKRMFSWAGAILTASSGGRNRG